MKLTTEKLEAKVLEEHQHFSKTISNYNRELASTNDSCSTEIFLIKDVGNANELNSQDEVKRRPEDSILSLFLKSHKLSTAYTSKLSTNENDYPLMTIDSSDTPPICSLNSIQEIHRKKEEFKRIINEEESKASKKIAAKLKLAIEKIPSSESPAHTTSSSLDNNGCSGVSEEVKVGDVVEVLNPNKIIDSTVQARVLKVAEDDESNFKLELNLNEIVGGSKKYYVHYINYEKRMDNWITEKDIVRKLVEGTVYFLF